MNHCLHCMHGGVSPHTQAYVELWNRGTYFHSTATNSSFHSVVILSLNQCYRKCMDGVLKQSMKSVLLHIPHHLYIIKH